MAKIFKGIINFIFVIAIVALLAYFILRSINIIEIYTVKTGSMEDKIHVGDYILVYKKDDYKVGDVVTFRIEGGYVTHRVVKINGDTLTTKGDANNTIDEDIKKNTIIGKVIFSGGALNILVKYKFAIVGILLSLYLVSCYIGDAKEEVDFDDNSFDDETRNDQLLSLDNNDNKEIIENVNNDEETINEEKVDDDNKTDDIDEQSEKDEIKELNNDNLDSSEEKDFENNDNKVESLEEVRNDKDINEELVKALLEENNDKEENKKEVEEKEIKE